MYVKVLSPAGPVLALSLFVSAAGCGPFGTVATSNDAGSSGTPGASCKPAASPPRDAAADAPQSLQEPTDDSGVPSLRAAASQHGRSIGAALAASHLSESDYAATAARELNYVTPENDMKFRETEPTEGQFTFAAGDAIVSFAEQHGMRVKGHNLVWYQDLPDWISSISSADDLRAALENHIRTVVTHFRGHVEGWDVVNEAIDDGGSGLRPSVFATTLGPDYIADAFRVAHEADPDARLYYNDYGGEGLGAKSDAIYALVSSLVCSGVPIRGVGLQMHTSNAGKPLPDDFASSIARLAALGLDVMISEMDVRVTDTQGTLADQLEAQRVRYHDILTVCMNQPRCTAMTFWGLTDKYSWLNDADPNVLGSGPGNYPLPFDDAYQPKPAYQGILDALQGR